MFIFSLKTIAPEPHPGESTKPSFLIFTNITGLHVVNWRMGIFAENIHDLTLTCCYSSGHDLVFGSVRGLHCTWLVPRTRVSSDGVDDLDLGEWIHLKRGIDRGGCGPIGVCGPRIMLCGGVRLPREDQEGLDTEVGPRSDLVGAPGVCSLMF
ncbi:hypothetical protein M9H77_11778 [Catharanthus roseus]|uniref:Uncharacterized protein n=1 Tax=Catharanthus roseus TaxID=4058 RepID=A0ACC0BFJ2_CATRO|nr:hypothetical protein M9H77_11778 [Catharanthus roseus]